MVDFNEIAKKILPKSQDSLAWVDPSLVVSDHIPEQFNDLEAADGSDATKEYRADIDNKINDELDQQLSDDS